MTWRREQRKRHAGSGNDRASNNNVVCWKDLSPVEMPMLGRDPAWPPYACHLFCADAAGHAQEQRRVRENKFEKGVETQ